MIYIIGQGEPGDDVDGDIWAVVEGDGDPSPVVADYMSAMKEYLADRPGGLDVSKAPDLETYLTKAGFKLIDYKEVACG